ncbi:MAG: hypothetical protein H7311_06605 [Ramlibacter sp.]|nr:hypothetical protein [Cryobacterium sp.]
MIRENTTREKSTRAHPRNLLILLAGVLVIAHALGLTLKDGPGLSPLVDGWLAMASEWVPVLLA